VTGRAGTAPEPPQLDLELGLGRDGGTAILRRHVAWPWSLPRGFRLAGAAGPLTVLPQAAAAALLPGDHWRHRIVLGPGARLHLVTAGATVVHSEPARPAPRPSRAEWVLSVAAGAALSHVPDPMVLSPGARVTQTLQAEVAEDGVLLLFDGLCRRDPAAPVLGGHWASLIEIRRPSGAVVLRDRQRAEETALADLHALPIGAAAAFGTALIVAAPAQLEALAPMLAPGPWEHQGVWGAADSLRHGQGIVLRLAARSGGALSAAFDALRGALRPIL